LRRELHEELGVEVSAARALFEFSHEYTERHVQLSVWLVDEFAGEPTGREGQQLQWLPPAALRTLPLLRADQPIVDWLERQ
jgi:8-oxo-dGTP diphosphatase